MDVRLTLFGKPQILYDGNPLNIRAKKAIALLAYLATTGKAHSRERLATLLWPDSKEDVARTSLRQIIQALRETPLAAVMVTNRNSIALHADVTSDVQEFLALVKRSERAQTPSTLEAVARMQAADSLYRGDFLEDFHVRSSMEWDDWQEFRRLEFQYQATDMVASLTHYYVQQGLADSGTKMAMRWLAMDPYNDEAHYLTMHLYMLNQHVESALEQYHFLVRLLEREQGRLPDAKLQQLYEQIRTGQYSPTNPFQNEPPAVRSLLPRPVYGADTNAHDYAVVQNALETSEGQSSSFIVIHDAFNHKASALISTLAHDTATRAAFPDGIFWAELDSTNDLDAILRLWLNAMRVSILKSTSKLEHLAWQFHNAQRGKRLLFLLENVMDERVTLLTPAYLGCTLVITTPHQDVAFALAQHSDYLIAFSTVDSRSYQYKQA